MSSNCENDNESSKRNKNQTTEDAAYPRDEVIGLDIGGQKFYTYRSTLTNGSQYFAVQFGGTFSAGQVDKDEKGRDVYFIDSDPEVFGHVLNFLRRGIATWPHKNHDPILHKRLIAEAEFFGVESMMAKLQPHVFKPNDSGKGVMYWLGTNKGNGEYRNPWQNSAVIFSGSCFDEIKNRKTKNDFQDCTKNFVQYRPKCQEHSFFDRTVAEIVSDHGDSLSSWWKCINELFWCNQSRCEYDLILDLVDVSVMPTHYSLRYSVCFGMSDWDFQGSTDGISWMTLHKARDDQSIRTPSEETQGELNSTFVALCQGRVVTTEEKQNIATSIAEEELRQTWRITTASDYCRYFRFVGAGIEEWEDGNACMHGVGFELYGEVQEIQ